MRTASDAQFRAIPKGLQTDFDIARLTSILPGVINPNLVFAAANDSQVSGANVHPELPAGDKISFKTVFAHFCNLEGLPLRLIRRSNADERKREKGNHGTAFHSHTSRRATHKYEKPPAEVP